jgi:hypothetical protein
LLEKVFDDGTGIFKRFKPVLVQPLLPKTIVEGLNERVIWRCSWTAECQFYLTAMGPFIQCFGDKLRTFINLNHLRQIGCLRETLQDFCDCSTRKRAVDFKRRTLWQSAE